MTNNQSHRALVEKVAEAIYKAQGGSFDAIGAQSMAPAATAALAVVYEALREPSDEMLKVGSEGLQISDGVLCFSNLAETFTDMIDASPIVQEE